jgi:hypothetical protein
VPTIRKVITKGGEIRWQVRVFTGRDENGKPTWKTKTLRTTRKKDAQRWASEILGQRDRGEITAGTCAMDELFNDLLLNFKINRKSEWASIVIKAHLRPYFGKMRVDRVTTNLIQQYVAKRQEDGRANGTIVREMTVLKRTFSFAAKTTPPKVGRIPHFPRLQEGPPRKGFFERTEYERLLAVLPGELKPILAFAFYTGC